MYTFQLKEIKTHFTLTFQYHLVPREGEGADLSPLALSVFLDSLGSGIFCFMELELYKRHIIMIKRNATECQRRRGELKQLGWLGEKPARGALWSSLRFSCFIWPGQTFPIVQSLTYCNKRLQVCGRGGGWTNFLRHEFADIAALLAKKVSHCPRDRLSINYILFSYILSNSIT